MDFAWILSRLVLSTSYLFPCVSQLRLASYNMKLLTWSLSNLASYVDWVESVLVVDFVLRVDFVDLIDFVVPLVVPPVVPSGSLCT